MRVSVTQLGEPRLEPCPAPLEGRMVGGQRHQPLHDPGTSAPGGERAGVILAQRGDEAHALQ